MLKKVNRGRPTEGDAFAVDYNYASNRGHQLHFNETLALELLEHIASGQSLRSFCLQKREDGKMRAIEGRPSMMTVLRWRAQIPEFSRMYDQARLDQADSLVDEIIDIADDESIDPKSRRVRVDSRKWCASKMKPKVYGDRVAVTGADGAPPVGVMAVPMQLSDAQLETIAAQALTAPIKAT